MAKTQKKTTNNAELEDIIGNGYRNLYVENRKNVVDKLTFGENFLEEAHKRLVQWHFENDATEEDIVRGAIVGAYIGKLQSIAECINRGEISIGNVVWEEVDPLWTGHYLEHFLLSIKAEPLRAVMLDYIVEQYKIKHTEEDRDKDFLQYCTDLKTHIEHYEAYNVEAVLKANAALEKRVSNHESAVYRHFSSTLTDEQLQAVMQALTDSKYLDADTDIAAWVWVCTGRGENVPTEPLKWTGAQNMLAVFTDWICGNKISTAKQVDWQTAVACFQVRKKTGEVATPDYNSLRQSLQKASDREKTKLLDLLKTATRQKEK